MGTCKGDLMAVAVASRPPSKLFRGDRIHYRHSTPDYTVADSWRFAVTFVTHDDTDESGDLQTTLDLDNVVSEYATGVWEIDLDSSGATTPSTKAWQVGLYHWREYVEKSGGVDRVPIRQGTMELLKSYDETALASAGGDFRTWARVALVNVEAVLQSKASKDQLSYSIAGRSLQHYTPDELMVWRKELRSIVDREDELEAIENDSATSIGTYEVEF